MAPTRKASRKMKRRGSRKMGRKGSKRNNQMGGWVVMNPAGVDDKTMMSPSSQSLAQGQDYDKIHMGQHGGAYTPMAGAPLDSTGLLDPTLREAARIGPIDSAISGIQGMSDQSGGGRRKGSKRKGRKGSKRNGRNMRRGSKRNARNMRRGSKRTMMGGNHAMRPGDYSGPTLLLPPAMESKALMTMNPEWKLAENPASFAPELRQ
jgi:hypothetical protein